MRDCGSVLVRLLLSAKCLILRRCVSFIGSHKRGLDRHNFQDPKVLTQIFLSIAFATKEELGWDPTISPLVTDNGGRAYRIAVDNEAYETEQVLSDTPADALVSQATRVWRVRRVGSGELYVLKDVWVEDDRDMEHEIRETILQDIEAKYGEDIGEEAKSHLLTPIAHCLVRVHGEPDHTTSIMMRGYTPSMQHRIKVRVKIATGSYAGGQEETDDSAIFEPRRQLRAPFPHCLHRRKIYRKQHYRVIFKEVAEDLYDVRSLSDTFLVLRDGTKGASLLPITEIMQV